jgi:ketosteroid isomerase-like protein
MKKLLFLMVAVCATSFWAQTQLRSAGNIEPDFRTFLARWEDAQSHFSNGDPTLWKQNSSQSEDATIFGAFGGYEKGWNEVGPRYDWAASQFRESGAKKQIEYLNTASGGEFAFSVAIERDGVRVGDQDKPAPRALRVTQIFRKEKGEWKLLHRHADPLVEKKAPSAVSEK